MPRSSSAISDEVAVNARSTDRFLAKVETLVVEGRLIKREAERAYAGAFLEFYANVERAIESLFLGLLRGRLKSSDSSVRPLIKVNSDAVARAILSSDRPFVDWLPYDNYTLSRARAFFSGGKPFSMLGSSDKSAFKDAAVVRNALAHQSSAAMGRFRKRLVESRNIPRDQRRPGPYLRGMHTIGQSRMNFMLGRLVVVMTRLSA